MKHIQAIARAIIVSAIVLGTGAEPAQASLVGNYTVGAGANTSYLQFEFANANTYLYAVRYDGSLRGSDLFGIVAGAQPGFFSYQVVSFGFGDALFGVAIGSDANEGFGNEPAYLDYWHYWTREAGATNWTNSMIGFGDRTVSNGSWDAWVFDSDAAPVAVPAPAVGAVLGAIAIMRRRRR
jgi:hypothetical protein